MSADKLYRQHARMVRVIARAVAREHGGGRVDLGDLEAAGCIGLMEAAARFDASAGVPFRGFARLRVRGAMLDFVRKASPTPRREHERRRAAGRVEVTAQPRPYELLFDDSGHPIAADAATPQDDALALAQLRARLREEIARLPDRERDLVHRHYVGGERFDHVAADLGLSKSWGSRLHTRAIGRLVAALAPEFGADPNAVRAETAKCGQWGVDR